jgi:hypothetical protein
VIVHKLRRFDTFKEFLFLLSLQELGSVH